jgi:hypothetical protein
MDTVHKHEFKLRELPTRAVTLFPARALVSRELKDLALRPGINEITIVGLTPTTDEDSIKVEGTGSAVISDISIEMLPNREIFEDIYPDSDDDEEEEVVTEEDDGSKFKASPESHAELHRLAKELVDIGDDRKLAQELVASVDARQAILDHQNREIKLTDPDHIRQNMEIFEKEREKLCHSRIANDKKLREMEERYQEAHKAWNAVFNSIERERRKFEIARQKADKAAAKAKNLEALRRAEVLAEKQRVRRERERFWPKVVYTVRITLDATAMASPSSSRRSSFASAADVAKPAPEPQDGPSSSGGGLVCGLILNYLTDAAFWAPSYDLQLSTTSDKASLLFDAKITNVTSETWSNCRVTLSTSQTTFSGLTDTIPSLTPWHIKLGPKIHHGKSSMSSSSFAAGNILNSNEEKSQVQSYKDYQVQKAYKQKPRTQMFGYQGDLQAPQAPLQDAMDLQVDSYLVGSQGRNMNHPQFEYQQQPIPPPAPAPAKSMRVPPGGTQNNNLSDYQMSLMTLEQQNKRRLMMARQSHDHDGAPQAAMVMRKKSREPEINEFQDAAVVFSEADEALVDGATIIEAEPELDFQDSSVEETGLTTTYDLPGTKTIVPRPTPFKQRVARVTLSNVVFSHTIVAKYKPLAYLKARLRNSSPVTVLRGRAGLTLDGTFLGQTIIPRCSVGDAFTLSLGIDPAVKVTYPAPEVRRATTGVFSKEDSSVYTRVATVSNTRAAAGGRPVNVVVYDQVPVSEDERLRVDVLHPKGLGVGGPGVAAGAGAKAGDKDWGRAVATIKKNGEVCWDATVQPGKSARLTLEYVVAMPSGESAVQC